jgi:tight adherence protein B
MTLWLIGALVALLVVMSRPRAAVHRLEGWRPDSARPRESDGAIGARDFVFAVTVGSGLAAAHLPVVAAVFGGVVPFGWTKFRRRQHHSRERDAREAAVADATFALAGELRAGRTPSEALRAAAATAGPLGGALLAAADSVAVGGSAAVELDAAAQLPGAARLRSVAAAWRVTESAGGRVALVLERLGEAMDREDQLQREMAAALAAPRATMVLLAGLPLVGLAMGQAIGAHPFHLLFYRPLGWALLVGATVLDAAGIVVSRRISQWALRC